jgi:deazaflavin-dependent oxidoreductase (nitroreductase family)
MTLLNERPEPMVMHTNGTPQLIEAPLEGTRLGRWLPYPGSLAGKLAARLPLLLFRIGLGDVLMALRLMVLTTRGRKSGKLRRAMLEFRRHGKKVYVVSAWGQKPQWVHNAAANPAVTVQIGGRVQHATATAVTDRAEATRALNLFRQKAPARYDNVMERMIARPVNGRTLREVSGDFTIYRLDMTDQPPDLAPLRVDLRWLWLAGLAALTALVLALILVGRKARPERPA